MKPECIVFDEATAMLDPAGRVDVMQMLNLLNKEQKLTIIHITHNMEEALLADRVIVLNDGEIALDGTPKEVFANVSSLHKMGLDVPQATELLYELNQAGYDFSQEVSNDDEVANLIFQKYIAEGDSQKNV